MPFLLPLGHWVNLISEPSNVKLLLMKGVSSPRLSSCILSLTIAPDQSTRIHTYMHRFNHYPKGGISGAIMPWAGGGGGLYSSATTEWRWKMHAPTSWSLIRGTQREYSSKPLKHSIVERL